MDPVTTTATTLGATAAAGPTAFEEAYPFLISLAIGALIGIERERRRIRGEEDQHSLPGGVRSFSLAALMGCASAWLGARYGAGVFGVALGGFSALVTAAYVMTSLKGDLGIASELALLFTFVLGAIAHNDGALLAVALAVATAAILSLRERLHLLASRLEAEDLYAALTLGVVSLIVLPILPDRGLGPWQVWNPFKIWLLVVFISGIGFLGYLGIKLFGAGRGIALAGLLGGVVSSTAATLTFSGRSRDLPALAGAFALAIALAWGAMFVRVLLSVLVVNADLARAIAPAVGAAGLAGIAGAGLIFWRGRGGSTPGEGEQSFSNPFSLVSALKFAALFAATLLVAKAAQVQFADAGVLAAAVLTGLLDVDAITLSAARLAREGQLPAGTAALAVYLAIAANTIMKAGMAATLGAPALRRSLVAIAGASLLAGGAVAWAVR